MAGLEELDVIQGGGPVVPPVQAELEEHPEVGLDWAQNGAGSSVPSPGQGSTASATASKTAGS